MQYLYVQFWREKKFVVKHFSDTLKRKWIVKPIMRKMGQQLRNLDNFVVTFCHITTTDFSVVY